MGPSRREFLGWAAGWAALALGRPGAAQTPTSALEAHRATRNTRMGALGTRVRALRAAARPFKNYPGKPRVALPAPSWEQGLPLFATAAGLRPARGFGGGSCTIGSASRLLALANGITRRGPGRALRAAPSAGALYAGELYLVAERVEGLAPGVYSYRVPSHELVRLREGPLLPVVAAALERPGAATGAAAAVLLTNVFARYRVRYANRGYRYGLIDSGHIGENLRLAAAELGLGEAAPLRWEDAELQALLGIDDRDESVCAVHLVGTPGASGTETELPDARPLVESRAVGRGAAPLRYHLATALVAAGEGAEARDDRTRPGGPDAPLHLDSAPRVPVHESIRVRRSAARFEAKPVERQALARILALAQGRPALRRVSGLDLYVVAHRVQHLEPGLYLYEASTGTLEARRPGLLAEALVEASLGQSPSGEAAVATVGVARLAEAVAQGGERAYRHLLLEAGAVAQRLYLGAEASGLAARNLAAYYDDELDALLGLDGQSEVAVHLTALGPGD